MNEKKSTEVDTMLRKERKKKQKPYEFYINDVNANKKAYKFKNNKINTTKYSFFTFLPLALLYQFVRIANCYYLLIVIIQSIPAISPLNAGSQIAPFCTVISISLIREAFEDYSRYKLDIQQNSEKTEVHRKGKWVKSRNEDLELGEIVVIRQDETFPADILLLDSSSNEGLAYVETATLDGEKALKMKIAQKSTAGLFSNEDNTPIDHFEMTGKAICDGPNFELHKLNGSMEIALKCHKRDHKTLQVPFDVKQMLLKGSKLKNTKWIIGFIIYAGHSTKLLLNFKRPRIKYSSVENSLSKYLFIILGIQVILCIASALCFAPYYNHGVKNNPYLPKVDNLTYRSFLNYFTYMLLLAAMIPISLVITIEFVKMIQAYFIYADANGYSFVRNYYINPRSPTLNEMLGCVNMIFSDKTGTLTQNQMHLKYCVIGDYCYKYIKNFHVEDDEKLILDEDKTKLKADGDIIPFNIGDMYKLSLSPRNFNIETNKEFSVHSESNPNCKVVFDNKGKVIEEFWKALALCHECSIEEDDNGIDYTGMSPDDIELVRSARLQGFEMIKSGSTSIRRISLGGEEEKDFEVLNLIEFTSDRKRASIIVREDNLIKLYIKGADSVIEEMLSPNTHPNFLKQSKYYVDQFSAQGFRTLFVGMKVLSEEEYQTFFNKFNEANFSLENKEELLKEAYKLVENNIYLIGSTIVEDKLQDSVPETIRDLRLAGVKVWMLTGDKMNTAYNIGLSCNLINKELKTFFLRGFDHQPNSTEGKEKTIQAIINFSKEYNYFAGEYENAGSVPKFGILVDEKALLEILSNPEMTMMFTNIANKAVSVICCRVSPKQKAQVVRMMKDFDRNQVTLSIGDGGNDVPMITEAHIGVGVFGEEGMQAVQSSDYAIGEFKILRRLLLFHGRTNYIRNSEMILYFFYKNFVFTIIHFYFAFYNNFSGQTIIDDWYITLYNKLFTAVPLGVNALFDLDLKQDDGKVVYKMMPFLYQETRDYPIFTKTTFILSLCRGIIHGMINYFVVIFTLHSASVNSVGDMADLWFVSVNLFTNIIITVSMRLLIITKYHTWIHALVMSIFSWVLYFAFISWVHFSTWFNSNATMGVAFSSAKFYTNLIFSVGTCVTFDYFTKCWDSFYNSTIANTLVRLLSQRKKLDSYDDLPKKIEAKLRMYEIYDQKSNDDNVIETMPRRT